MLQIEKKQPKIRHDTLCPLHMEQINVFAQIYNPYEVTPIEFAQINDILFAHVYKACSYVQGLKALLGTLDLKSTVMAWLVLGSVYMELKTHRFSAPILRRMK